MLDKDLVQRAADSYRQYGAVNGYGQTKLDNYSKVSATGKEAIRIFFEHLNPGVKIEDISPG